MLIKKKNLKYRLIQAVLRRIVGLRNRHFFAIDLVTFLVTPALALALRQGYFEEFWPVPIDVIGMVLFFAAMKFTIFYFSGMYKRYWRYASVDELGKIILSGIMVFVVQTAAFFLFFQFDDRITAVIPRSLPMIDGVLSIMLTGGIRFSVRLSERLYQKLVGYGSMEPVLIVGAGDAGVMIVEELQSNPQLGLEPVGFIDDARDKRRAQIRGVSVLGNRKEIPTIVEETGAVEIIIAMPRAPGKTIREIVGICESLGIKTKIIPGMYELLGGTVGVNKLRNVQIDDLLRREPVQTNVARVRTLLAGKRVMVTGGGGSIGSELCRQVASCSPSELIILGHGENSVFAINGELSRTFKGLKHSPVIADVRNEERIDQVMNRFRPDVIFHAAAHKHVPLMEENPEEAVSNNVVGTMNVLDSAIKYDVERFVLISTDKAVNPTSIMGATKRLAEIVTEQAAQKSGKSFVAVRFGNVLGSRGSVVPLFQEQISSGGPVTVTHPDVKRYFMTIPEAVQLVLQAATMGKQSEVFMLDMGEPIRILDLARDLIRLSGLEEGRDIDIAFTGLRPGEKLVEELSHDDEHFNSTDHMKIFVYTNGKSPGRHLTLRASIAELVNAARSGDVTSLRKILQALVPDCEFQISGNGHSQLKDSNDLVDASPGIH